LRYFRTPGGEINPPFRGKNGVDLRGGGAKSRFRGQGERQVPGSGFRGSRLKLKRQVPGSKVQGFKVEMERAGSGSRVQRFKAETEKKVPGSEVQG